MRLSSVPGLHCHLPGVCVFFFLICRHVNLMQLTAPVSEPAMEALPVTQLPLIL